MVRIINIISGSLTSHLMVVLHDAVFPTEILQENPTENLQTVEIR